MKAGISTRARITSGSRKCSREPAIQKGAVDRVLDKIGKDNRHDELNGPRQRGYERLNAVVHRPREKSRCRHRRCKRKDADQQMIEREITEIMPPVGAQNRLLANVEEQLFEENKDHRR
jgi:hypothetical protein